MTPDDVPSDRRPFDAGVLSRRSLLKAAMAVPVLPRVRFRQQGTHVAVIGAGAFGGWTALQLLRRGARVTLVDAWGPGNARASSGGETRVIRGIYGNNRIYVEMVVRALQLWREAEARWGGTLYRRLGALWMTSRNDPYVDNALPLLRQTGMRVDDLSLADASARFPQVNFEGVERIVYEREAGYLRARLACELVLRWFIGEGGEYRQRRATPGQLVGDGMDAMQLSDGSTLTADQYVFACGPWLGTLFPDVIGERIAPTRQEVFYFGAPAGDPRFVEEQMPVWIDNGARLYYGIPGNQWRGFKLADDTRGGSFDPTDGDRTASAEALESAREYLSFRFPALVDAPLVEARVCQYEDSPDGHFIVDRHPWAENVWLVGGGSGHGFKHGPALGEYVAQLVLSQRDVNPFFGLSRLG
jgi:glycine/D-amino acid oxidase-like deaminating enzyme